MAKSCKRDPDKQRRNARRRAQRERAKARKELESLVPAARSSPAGPRHYSDSPSNNPINKQSCCETVQSNYTPLAFTYVMVPNWKRLIRFESTDGRVLRGEPILPSEDFDVGSTTEETGLKARVIHVATGGIFDEQTKVTDEEVTVKKLLGPVEESEVPIIRCVGLNFMKHIKEGGRTLPPFPTTFIKATTCLNDHGSPIVIPTIAQDSQADYEGELCFIISRDAKNVPESEAHNYIGGYLCGNDVSSRKLQRDPNLAGTVPQWNFSKGFDTYCPLGPQIVSTQVIPDASKLYLKTKVNGEVRQSETMADLCFRVPYLVSYMSQGTTLKKGTVIMTGTPSGVGYAMKEPQFLKPGDVVEVEILPSVGTLKNPVEYEEGGLLVPPQGKS